MTFNIKINQYTPSVSSQDRARGYMVRYFVAKANQINDKAYEVDQREYKRLQKNRYIVSVKTIWKISGPLNDVDRTVWVDGQNESKHIISVPGVLTQNEASVIFVSKKIPAVKKILRNLQEFYLNETPTGQ